MALALKEAKKAYAKGNVPVGAAIFKDGALIAKAHNTAHPLGHAELLAIQKAMKKLGGRLEDCDLYVTLEPCAMCAGALALARIKRLYFGAYDTQSGACGGKIDVLREGLSNHRVEVFGGIMEKECETMLTAFFEERRKQIDN